jgi:hypothetical protein
VAETHSNVDVAHDLTHHGQHHGGSKHEGTWISFIEAAVLAIVAVATAWSGYQASRWDGHSARNYALYERSTVLAQEKSTLAGQDRLYDIVTFNGWVAAKTASRERLAAFYERRFRPEYMTAFRAWMRQDPFHNQSVAPGPIFMKEYKNANALAADRFETQASKYYAAALSSRDAGDNYVRVTVILATVLFLTAIAQRFQEIGPRVALMAVAAVLLLISIFWIFTFERT